MQKLPAFLQLFIEQCQSHRSKIFLLAGLLMTLEIARYYSIDLRQSRHQLKQTTSQLASLQQKQASLVKYRLNPQNFTTQSQVLQTTMQQIEKAIPQTWKPEVIFRAVNHSLKASSMILIRQTVKDKKNFKYYEELEISLELQGTYHAWNTFFEVSKQWNFLSTIRHLEIIWIGGKIPLKIKYRFATFRRIL